MNSNNATIEHAVKTFILDEFLPDEDPADLNESTPLMTAGILDSIATLKLVTFLEEKFGIAIEPHEADADRLNTISLIGNLVASKLAKNRR